MPVLKPITPHQQFYQKVLELRRQLDQLIVEYEASLPKEKYKRKPVKLIDPETGKPYKNKKGKNYD